MKRLRRALLLAPLLLATTAFAQRRHPAPPLPPGKNAPPLPSLPSIPRIRVEAARDHVLVLEEIDLPRGTWESGDLDLYVAFGAPGAPQAFDAHLLAVPDGALAPLDDDTGEPLPLDRAPRCPPTAQPLLGPPQMAGAILHIREPAFRRATAPGNMAALRLRALLPLPAEDARTGREIVVRLGAADAVPLTLGRVQIASIDRFVARAEAHFCGDGPASDPLAIAFLPPPAPAPPRIGLAPVLTSRRPNDDLCVRLWTAPGPATAPQN